MSLPSGTVTFLFTDVEGSTRLWEQHPAQMRPALARHDALAQEIIGRHGGVLLKERGEGDSLFIVFPRATDAVSAVLALQQAFLTEDWPPEAPLRVRVALHTGEASDVRDGGYYGAAVNRCARLRSLGHGGQVLLSATTQALVQAHLPYGVTLRDLGLHGLRDLSHPEQVFQLLHPDLPADFPPLKSLDVLPNNLPLQLTSFIGREAEMAEVKRLLSSTRLLTLTGAGGCGKTRLSLQVAADVADDYPEGVWMVDLAPVSTPDLVTQAVASVLGIIEESAGFLPAITGYLRRKRLLLLLDNCEHLLVECARVVDAILHACPDVTILATSREGFNTAGEQVYRVPTLGLPEADLRPTPKDLEHCESVLLFRERARQHQPTFAVVSSNAPALAQVCRRLDGIPLAIELAAARVRIMPVEQIATRLDDRFRLLTGGSRTALPHHQTLLALMDWSHELLNEPERILFRRLSVFVGGWTLEAAEAVCAGDGIEDWDVLNLMTSLLDKSLVVYEEQHASGRYRLLETVGQYAAVRLRESGEEDATKRRHRDYFLRMAEEAEPELLGAHQVEWLEQLESEHDNLRAAWDTAVDRAPQEALRLSSALGTFWFLHGYISEGRWRLEKALSLPGETVPTRIQARLWNRAGAMAYRQGDIATAKARYEKSLELSRQQGDQQEVAKLLSNLGILAKDRGDYAAARALYEESLAIRRRLGDRQGVAIALNNLGEIEQFQGESGAARALYEECLEISRDLGDQHGIATALNNLGLIAVDQADYPAARSCYGQCLPLYEELGDKSGIAKTLNNIGELALYTGDRAAARRAHERSMALFRELEDDWGIALNLIGLGDIACQEGDTEKAVASYQESFTISKRLDDKQLLAASLFGFGLLNMLLGQTDNARSYLEQVLDVRLKLGDRKGVAKTQAYLAVIAFLQGDSNRASERYRSALSVAWELKDRRICAQCLEGLTRLMHSTHPWQAACLFGAVESMRQESGLQPDNVLRSATEDAVAAIRKSLGEQDFRTAYAEGRSMTLEQAIRYSSQ